MGDNELLDLLAIGIVPALLCAVAVGTAVRGGGFRVGRARLAGAVVAVAMIPVVAFGDVRVFALFVALNLTIGWYEVVPFSWFGMFSTMPNNATAVFLQTADGHRVRPETLGRIRSHELTKVYNQARRGARTKLPGAAEEEIDGVAAHFVRSVILERRSHLIEIPADLRIMRSDVRRTGRSVVVSESVVGNVIDS